MKISNIVSIILLLLLILLYNYTPKNYKNFSDLNAINKKLMIAKAILTVFAIILYISQYIVLFFLVMTKEVLITMLFFLLMTLIIILLMFIVNKIKTKRMINKFKGNMSYVRNIPKDVSITTVAYLANKKLNFEKSIKLTILDLYCKKYINVIIKDGNIEVAKGYNINNSEIKLSELYILEYLFSDNKENFNIDNWYNIIKEELIEEKYVEETDKYKLTTLYFIIYSILFLPFATYYLTSEFYLQPESIFSEHFILGFSYSIIPLIFFYIYESKNRFAKLVLTDKGYQLKTHLSLLKNFLKEFTNMNKSEIKEVYLWEEYLVYANALNINYNHAKLDNIKMKRLSDASLKEYIEDFIYRYSSKNDDFY